MSDPTTGISEEHKGRLLRAVFNLMKDEGWRTLGEIRYGLANHGIMYTSETSVSARLRDLRKQKYGAHLVERRKFEKQIEYRVVVKR